MRLTTRLWNLLVSVDQNFNCLLGSGYADETLSAYSYRVGGWRYTTINMIFFWQKDHCYDAYTSELFRKHLPRGYEYKETTSADKT